MSKIFLIITLLILYSCGNKGDLYLPGTEQTLKNSKENGLF
jgi:predicted small lipoprotein YifL